MKKENKTIRFTETKAKAGRWTSATLNTKPWILTTTLTSSSSHNRSRHGTPPAMPKNATSSWPARLCGKRTTWSSSTAMPIFHLPPHWLKEFSMTWMWTSGRTPSTNQTELKSSMTEKMKKTYDKPEMQTLQFIGQVLMLQGTNTVNEFGKGTINVGDSDEDEVPTTGDKMSLF